MRPPRGDDEDLRWKNTSQVAVRQWEVNRHRKVFLRRVTCTNGRTGKHAHTLLRVSCSVNTRQVFLFLFSNAANGLRSLRRCVAGADLASLTGFCGFSPKNFKGWEIKEAAANSCGNLKLEQRRSVARRRGYRLKNGEVRSVTFKQESCDNTSMLVCTVFEQINHQVFLPPPTQIQ